MDTNEYIRRMEAVVAKANTALIDLTGENATLKEKVAELERQLLTALRRAGPCGPPIVAAPNSNTDETPPSSTKGHNPTPRRYLSRKLACSGKSDHQVELVPSVSTVGDEVPDEALNDPELDKLFDDSSEEEEDGFDCTTAPCDVVRPAGASGGAGVAISMTEMAMRLQQKSSTTAVAGRRGGIIRDIPACAASTGIASTEARKHSDGEGEDGEDSPSADASPNSNSNPNSSSGGVSMPANLAKQQALPGKTFRDIVSITSAESGEEQSGLALTAFTTKAAGNKLYTELAVIGNCKLIMIQIGTLARLLSVETTSVSVSADQAASITAAQILPSGMQSFVELLVDSFMGIVVGQRVELGENSVRCGGILFVETLLVPMLTNLALGRIKAEIPVRLLRLASREESRKAAYAFAEAADSPDAPTGAPDAHVAAESDASTIGVIMSGAARCYLVLSCLVRFRLDALLAEFLEQISTLCDQRIHLGSLVGTACFLSLYALTPRTEQPCPSASTGADITHFKRVVTKHPTLSVDIFSCVGRLCLLATRQQGSDPIASAVTSLSSELLNKVKSAACFAHFGAEAARCDRVSPLSKVMHEHRTEALIYQPALLPTARSRLLAMDVRFMCAEAGLWECLLDSPAEEPQSDCYELLQAFRDMQLQGVGNAARGVMSVLAMPSGDEGEAACASKLSQGLVGVGAWGRIIAAAKGTEVRSMTVWSVEEKLLDEFGCKWQHIWSTQGGERSHARSTTASLAALHAYFQSLFHNYARCSSPGPSSPIRDFGWKVGEGQYGESIACSLASRLSVAKTRRRELFVSIGECCSKFADADGSNDQGPCCRLAAISRRHSASEATGASAHFLCLSLPFLTTSLAANSTSAGEINAGVSTDAAKYNILSDALGMLDSFREVFLAAKHDGVEGWQQPPDTAVDPSASSGMSEDDANVAANRVLLHQVWVAFGRWSLQMSELKGLISLACLEWLYYSAFCSANALLEQCLQVQVRAGQESVGSDDAVVLELCSTNASVSTTCSDYSLLCVSLVRFLITAPLPWGGNSNGYHVGRVCRLTTHLSSTLLRWHAARNGSGIAETLPLDIVRWLNAASARIPSLVINLDRRFDRWYQLLRQWECNGMLAVRVSAKDGQQLESDNVDEDQAAGLVARSWDSTLNAQFDKKCISSSVVPLSTSERGCAWSHLTVWKSIQLISNALFGNNITQFEENSAVDGAEDWKNAALLYKGCFSRGLVPLLRPKASLGVDKASLKKRLKQSVSRCEPMPYFDSLRLIHRQNEATVPVKPTSRTSHMSAGSAIAGGNGMIDWYLIMEDDAVVKSCADNTQIELRARVLALLSEVPSDWDVLYLGCVVADDEVVRANRLRGADAGKKRDIQEITEAHKLSKWLKEIHYSWHAHAYIIRSTCATKLLRFLPVHMPVDNFISTLVLNRKLKAYAASTQLVKQQSTRHEGTAYRGNIRHTASLREGHGTKFNSNNNSNNNSRRAVGNRKAKSKA